ncbi:MULTISPECIES: RNA polymerase sigma-70 factor [Proteiniphilum]|jgi:RNA polymerase sigma-70 factor (ECF subfamily)|uniref:RNA polymerase sigma-70 factor n=2 Tax=Dysgonomonadaceae TaxID=2005520 RepID=UPI001EEAFD4E|nr:MULTISPECIES: RNA polymerase sigma-70 factor [Proteiniphilum]ULB34786.1 RNA polymerase sigma-70 factor [Proteiniphilum propionicum]
MEKNLETDIIEGLKLGKEEAFQYIYKIYYSDLCRIAKGYLADSYLSESIVGDLIYSLWENRSKIEIHTSLRSYLFRSVANKCINYLQLEYVRRETSCSQDDIEAFSDLWSMGDNPLQDLEHAELVSIIRNTIETMSPETKQVFLLSRFENKKQKEIAEIMGITVHTVKYHMGSALKKLKESMELYLPFIIFFMMNMFN